MSSTSSQTGVTHEYRYHQPAAPAHDRGHELRASSVRPRRQATSAVASVSLHFSSGLPTRPPLKTSAISSCTWPRPAQHLQPQPHHDRAAVLVPRDAAAAGSCRRDLSPPRTAEDSAGDEPGRDQAPAGRRQQPQGPHPAQSRLWLRPARRRSGPAEGQAYRQRTEDHSHRAVQGPQGSQCHAVARDARSVAPMVEGAPIGSMRRRPSKNAGCFPAAGPASR